VSETDGHPTGADPRPRQRSPRPSWLRLAVEFALLFAIAVVLKQFIVTGTNYPNPLWLPVVVLSLEHGLAAGVAATIIATGIQYSGGVPPAYLTEDMYAYIGRVATEPVSWACVALLIGHFRSRQIANFAELQADLAERSEHCAVVADLCDDLRSRTEMLERHIAANAHASNADIAEAIRDLNDSTWDNFAQRLTRFVALMTGAADFSIFLLRDNALQVVFQPDDQHTAAGDVTIASDDALFAAIVNERRMLSATDLFDRELLGEYGSLAAPLLGGNASNRVIGMFAIGGSGIDDLPEDIGRTVALTAAEISRLLDRITLIESWHAAVTPGRTNGHLDSEKADDEGARAGKARPRPRPMAAPGLTAR
jgi:hypothetical protein